MKIFVVNCGSSSIKFQLIDTTGWEVVAKGVVERIGLDHSVLKYTPTGRHTIDIPGEIHNHQIGIDFVLKALQDPEYGVVSDLTAIDAVGHRVVHGGERFTDSVLITDEVTRGIELCCEIAPLHNPPNLLGIRACAALMPDVPQVAVFDTAFHQTMPPKAFLYGLPYELYKEHGVRRFGFHGTSHRYVAQMAADMMHEHLTDVRIITCHLGNGASIAAVKYGRSVDTSMGYTPLDGIVMGTRSGEIDPAIISVLIEKGKMSSQEIYNFLNKECGVLGLSGLSSDFRDLSAAAAQGDERSQLAIDVFCYQVKKRIGSYVAAMGGVDAIVFTAGVGENSPQVRDKVCNGLEYLGTRLDPERNNVRGKAAEISVVKAKVKIYVIPTNEELVIARDTYNICRRLALL